MDNIGIEWHRLWYLNKKIVKFFMFLGAATVELVSVSQMKPFLKTQWQLADYDLGLISMCTFSGEIVGALLWGWCGDLFGREPVFLCTSALMAVSAVALPLVPSYFWFCVTRGILGVAIGGGLGVDFVYFLECVPVTERAFRTCYIVFMGILGLMFSAVSGYILLELRQSLNTFMWMCAVPALILIMGRLFWRFESPKYLAAKNRMQEAEQILNAIERINGVKRKQNDLEKVNSLHDATDSGSEIDTKFRYGIVVAAAAVFFCQSSAYYGLTMWISKFLQPWNLSPSRTLIWISLAELPGLFLTASILKQKHGDGFPKNQASNITTSKTILKLNFSLAALVTIVVPYVKGQFLASLLFCLLYGYSVLPELFPVPWRSRCFGVAATVGKIGGLLSPMAFGWWLSVGGSLSSLHLFAGALFFLGSISSAFLR